MFFFILFTNSYATLQLIQLQLAYSLVHLALISNCSFSACYGCCFWLFCIYFFVLLLVLKRSKRVYSFICTSLCVCVCVLALYVVCFSVSSLSLLPDTDRDTDISHRTTKKVKNAARVYLCMPISLFFSPYLHPSLSLGSWRGTTISGNGFFAQKWK